MDEPARVYRKDQKTKQYARESDSPPAAEVIKESLTLKFFDSVTFIKTLALLEKELKLTYFAEKERR